MKPIATPVLIPWILALVVWSCGCGNAADAEPAVGDAAPAFDLAGSDGRTYGLDALAGKTVVLAWFPKAFTGG